MSQASASLPAPTPLQFHAMTLAVAVVAALSTFGALEAMLPASAMFLGWVAYSIGAQTPREGAANLVCFLLGLAFGIGTTLVIKLLGPALGDAATPVAVFGVVVLVLSLRALVPINNGLAYFLGITCFFYSGLAPDGAAFGTLAAAGVIGATSAAVAGALQAAIQRRGPNPRPAS